MYLIKMNESLEMVFGRDVKSIIDSYIWCYNMKEEFKPVLDFIASRNGERMNYKCLYSNNHASMKFELYHPVDRERRKMSRENRKHNLFHWQQSLKPKNMFDRVISQLDYNNNEEEREDFIRHWGKREVDDYVERLL